MSVKAKFKCDSVTNYEYNQAIEMSAVCGKDGENADFCKATPWGSLKMHIDKNTPAFNSFTPGETYYLSFDKAE